MPRVSNALGLNMDEYFWPVHWHFNHIDNETINLPIILHVQDTDKCKIMASAGRKYDIVLFGATGYTGQYTAEHIAASFPTNLSWALAGRSREKLENIARLVKEINSDRKEPSTAAQLCRNV